MTVHEYETRPVAARDEPSVAVTVTLYVPATVGVPEMEPVEELIDRPAGNPEVDHEYGAVPPEAVWLTGEIGVPTALVWLPGLLRAKATDHE